MLSFGELSQNLAMYELGTYMIYRCGSVTHHRLTSYLLGVRVSILLRKDNQCFIGYYYRELDRLGQIKSSSMMCIRKNRNLPPCSVAYKKGNTLTSLTHDLHNGILSCA